MFDGAKKHRLSTGAPAPTGDNLDLPQVAARSEVLELVWGLEPQTCSLRVTLPRDMPSIMKVIIVESDKRLCNDKALSRLSEISQDNSIVKHPESTDEHGDG